MVTNICVLYHSLGNLSSEQGEISVCLDIQSRLLEGDGSECCTVCFTIGWLSWLRSVWI